MSKTSDVVPNASTNPLLSALMSSSAPSLITTALSGCIWQPILTITTRQQVTARMKGIKYDTRAIVTDIVQKEGIRTFWRGLTPRLMQSFVAQPQWLVYEAFKLSLLDNNINKPYVYGSIAILCRFLVTFIKCPFEIAKENMQVQGLFKVNHLKPHANMFEHWKYLVKYHGMGSLFTALPINFLRDVMVAFCIFLGSDMITHMYLHKELKTPSFTSFIRNQRSTARRGDSHNKLVLAMSGALAGFFAALITQPIDVIKTQLQTAAIIQSSTSSVLPMAGAAATATAGAAATTATTAATTATATAAINASDQAFMNVYKQGFLHRSFILPYITSKLIYKEHGIRGLWRGFPFRALHMSLGTALYMPLYRWMEGKWMKYSPEFVAKYQKH